MAKPISAYVYFLGWIILWILRFPYIRQSVRTSGELYGSERYDQFLVGFLFLGTSILPLIYIFTSWLEFADYAVPYPLVFLCALLYFLGLVLLRKAHLDLGEQYSQDLEIKSDHVLVTGGIYGAIRHPMYAAGFLLAVAQIGLVQNWIAGFSGILALSIFYHLRVPREEAMMSDTFGEAYLSYKEDTNALIPFLH